ncbi:aminotransferase class III-fold pyridoxal phosphate-dependent enzyme [Virgibacillus sp. NKC19-16]|uniref:aminotransferase class III-fold pyridoxal phosphate-dependent enzyme n=1 Tax=Virgibacillus salidurans TaxID=2831673 RepID=UPI001F16B808|nr:aminotransferase class III-fold pyridoxal phosphate-dependent enzyme [Virgibacillus sp. NKC19-16]UJL45694.1 aminotransferase class III-fold pyridoxal phosphate-dependent enzyme [Virgibacillus sp. NKC19-16]
MNNLVNKMDENMKWLKRENEVLGSGMRLPFFPLVIKEAKGEFIYDYDGNKWIDFLSSACVTNTGHAHPVIIDRMKEQMDQLVHYNPAYASHENLIALSEELIRITPGNFSKKVTYGLSGSDANDTAIKLARSYTRKSKILAFSRSYHGNTYGALSASAVSLPMRQNMGPLLPDIYHIPFPDIYRPQFKTDNESERCIAAIKHILETVCPPEEIAAIIIEPIQGDSGVIVPQQAFIDELKQLCNEHGILIIADEVQTGFGRTGKWFASEHFQLEPDLTVMGKAIASGMPLSAVVGRSEIMTSWQPPAGAFSLAANPISCVASRATIEVIETENLTKRAQELGSYIKNRFRYFQERFGVIGDIRGEGLMLGIDLVGSQVSKEPNHSYAAKICWSCWEKGLFLTFFSGSVLRIAPPLTIKEEYLEQALQILEESFEDVTAGRVPDSVLDEIKGW